MLQMDRTHAVNKSTARTWNQGLQDGKTSHDMDQPHMKIHQVPFLLEDLGVTRTQQCGLAASSSLLSFGSRGRFA